MFAEFRHKLKTQRLFCTVYVLGTALSVASVMLLVIFLHIRLSPVYPEVNRPDTYILDDAVWLEEDHNENESGCLTMPSPTAFAPCSAPMPLYHPPIRNFIMKIMNISRRI